MLRNRDDTIAFMSSGPEWLGVTTSTSQVAQVSQCHHNGRKTSWARHPFSGNVRQVGVRAELVGAVALHNGKPLLKAREDDRPVSHWTSGYDPLKQFQPGDGVQQAHRRNQGAGR